MPRPPKNTLGFNDRSLRAVRAARRRVDYMDLGLHGFGLMVRPTGRKTFFVRYRLGRTERRMTLGDYPAVPLTDARKAAKEIFGRVAKGDDPQAKRQEERAAPTFGELAASYLEVHAKQRKRTWKEDQRILRCDLLPAWSRVLATRIRRRDVAALMDGIVGRGAPVMANRVRALASKIFAFAVEREIVEFNPVAGLPPQGEERSRERVLSAEEIRALWTAWDAERSVTSAIFQLLLLTAQREIEVMTMQWQHLDGAWWTIPADVVKNKLQHRVFLCSEALELLERLRQRPGHSPWVFPSPRRKGRPVTSINKAKERFRAATDIPDWRPHDLRRTAVTFMRRLGVPRAAVSKVLNHVEPGVTSVYDRAGGDAEVGSALITWGAGLAEILRGEEETRSPTTLGK
ncbi:MAG TPA: integrase arm-type DNA-binding domain-containing protein [Thermoanaerobaculia bacterium]|nr:integrase arm-type DNA-binding domain-containing protein [Thermoanaerobaculia bacterium]